MFTRKTQSKSYGKLFQAKELETTRKKAGNVVGNKIISSCGIEILRGEGKNKISEDDVYYLNSHIKKAKSLVRNLGDAGFVELLQLLGMWIVNNNIDIVELSKVVEENKANDERLMQKNSRY